MKPIVINSDKASYAFCIHDHPGEILAVGGLYLYLRLMENGEWRILYAGQTDSLTRRILHDHHVDDGHARAIGLGATHVATFPGTWSEADRRLLEDDLISFFRPPANDNTDLHDKLLRILAGLR